MDISKLGFPFHSACEPLPLLTDALKALAGEDTGG